MRKLKIITSLLITICMIVTLMSVISLPAHAAVVTGYTNQYTYVRMAPYWTASVVDTMASGVTIKIQERDYDYIYIEYTKDGITKRGYIPRANSDATGYSWCNHTYFVPGTCSATKTVYYSPSTSSSSCGTIYSGENPLLILNESGNYYYVQYTTNPSDTGSTNPKFKRGWVTKTSVAISYTTNAPIPNPNVSAKYTLIRNHSGKYLTAVADSSQTSGYKVTFCDALNSTNQHWILHRFVTNSCVYYKIQSVSTGLYLEVDGKIPVIGTKLNLAAHADPQKAQEFSFKTLYSYEDSSFSSTQYDYGVRMYTRCSRDYLTIQHSGTNTNLVQYRKATNITNQFMYLDPIDNQWDNEYLSGRRALTYYIHSSAIKENITATFIVDAVSEWNSISNISLSRVYSVSSADIIVEGSEAISDLGLFEHSPGSASQDDDWTGGTVKLNTNDDNANYLGKCNEDEIKRICTHEFGHALKLRHPHEYYNSKGEYDTVAIYPSVMNQDLPITSARTKTPTLYDTRSLKIKWD